MSTPTPYHQRLQNRILLTAAAAVLAAGGTLAAVGVSASGAQAHPTPIPGAIVEFPGR